MFEVTEQDIPLFMDRTFWPSPSTESSHHAFPTTAQMNMLSTTESLLGHIETRLFDYRITIKVLWDLDAISVNDQVDLTAQLDFLRHDLKVSAISVAQAKLDASLLQCVPICSERMLVPLRAIQVLMTQTSFSNSFREFGPEILAQLYKLLQIIKHDVICRLRDSKVPLTDRWASFNGFLPEDRAVTLPSPDEDQSDSKNESSPEKEVKGTEKHCYITSSKQHHLNAALDELLYRRGTEDV
ncbi:hypothetical protein IFR05_002450 [Cadophora sp. M221]|nr:hypothetical protein IFR05_002450 [Cadophora sp. M221]